MKKTITCILLTAGLTGYLSAQTPVQDKSDKNSGKVICMDKQMFLDNIFDYTSGSTNWKYKGEKPAVIDFYVMKITLGFSFTPNLVSIVGMIIALFLFNRF